MHVQTYQPTAALSQQDAELIVLDGANIDQISGAALPFVIPVAVKWGLGLAGAGGAGVGAGYAAGYWANRD